MIKPWLWLPPQLAHDLGPTALSVLAKLIIKQPNNWSPLEWKNLYFPNPVGIAGGVDKNAASLKDWHRMGAGFLEVGTVTPKPQGPNPGKIMDRDGDGLALWNKMGFPNKGCEIALKNIRAGRTQCDVPVFVNVGKNRDTPLEKAHEDYLYCIDQIAPSVDGVVINVSSPNTQQLRELLAPERLRGFLQPLIQRCQKLERHCLLKISPDIDEEQLKQILDTSFDLEIDGWILTNTTTARRKDSPFAADGGVSGQPLASASIDILKKTVQHLGERRRGKLIVSCGGLLTPSDIFERLRMGANLVQVYTALVFQGPLFFRQVAKQARYQ